MAGKDPGAVLFHRETNDENANEEAESEEDLWDDTALIEAYDKAVKLAKDHIRESDVNESATASHRPGTKDQKKKKKQKKKGNSAAVEHSKQWRVGDQCIAVFTDDQQEYEAEIESINEREETCLVRYSFYGNSETQYLQDLGESSNGRESRHRDKPPHTPRDVRMAPPPIGRIPSHAPLPATNSTSSPFHPAPSANHLGPRTSHPQTPAIPPPLPPSIFPPGQTPSENEALSSMLISWYMSGYHSGYYQGLKEGREG